MMKVSVDKGITQLSIHLYKLTDTFKPLRDTHTLTLENILFNPTHKVRDYEVSLKLM